ncbi:hypothetical protein OXR01_07125 [Staphylococcus gallinarum]|uniref:hypothetical protein n=1 Tax=Staphylococcus gallinarum TaxID=1293 RepID=UPI00227E36F3|nr:hypothetical protein [Staphylococcus gallinarum]MDN6413709.1 hypothetical protein [Staphylococcus gallinarum]
MIINNEEFGYVHFNTGGKELSDDEVEEMKEWLRSKKSEKVMRKSEETHRRVMESKITDRTIM